MATVQQISTLRPTRTTEVLPRLLTVDTAIDKFIKHSERTRARYGAHLPWMFDFDLECINDAKFVHAALDNGHAMVSKPMLMWCPYEVIPTMAEITTAIMEYTRKKARSLAIREVIEEPKRKLPVPAAVVPPVPSEPIVPMPPAIQKALIIMETMSFSQPFLTTLWQRFPERPIVPKETTICITLTHPSKIKRLSTMVLRFATDRAAHVACHMLTLAGTVKMTVQAFSAYNAMAALVELRFQGLPAVYDNQLLKCAARWMEVMNALDKPYEKHATLLSAIQWPLGFMHNSKAGALFDNGDGMIIKRSYDYVTILVE